MDKPTAITIPDYATASGEPIRVCVRFIQRYSGRYFEAEDKATYEKACRTALAGT